jgi:hypothetical protein
MKNSATELGLRIEGEVSLKLYFSGVKVRPRRLHQRWAKIVVLRIVATVTAYRSNPPMSFVLCQANFNTKE